jgi:quercetin dioxygenase-like cupin family protein
LVQPQLFSVRFSLLLSMLICFGSVLLWSTPAQDRKENAQQPGNASSQSTAKPEPKTVPINPGVAYQVLLSPPETVRTRSGYVVLAPGKSVGRHSTQDNEEILVILEGTGEFSVEGGPTLKMSPEVILYCPPNRFHNVTNTGAGTLRYFYIVGQALERR